MKSDQENLVKLLVQLNEMLQPGEKSLCPVYCVFRSSGLFTSPLSKGAISNVSYGFITVTDHKRVLTVQKLLFDTIEDVHDLTTISDFKITNMPLKQKALSMVFHENGKKVKVKLQAAEKVIGNGLPEQADNLEYLIVLLSRHGA